MLQNCNTEKFCSKRLAKQSYTLFEPLGIPLDSPNLNKAPLLACECTFGAGWLRPRRFPSFAEIFSPSSSSLQFPTSCPFPISRLPLTLSLSLWSRALASLDLHGLRVQLHIPVRFCIHLGILSEHYSSLTYDFV